MVEGRTIHIPDVLADPEFTRLDTQRAGNFRTVLAVPLLRESTPIGVIFLYRFAVRPFRDRQIELVTSFADQAVIAIENVRLFDEVQARTAELMEALQQQTATSEVLQVINASPRKLTPVFDAMLAKAAQLCNAELGILWTYDNGTFVIAAERGTPAPSTIFGTEPVRPGPTTGLARIAREKRVVHIPDLREDEAYRVGEPIRVASVDRLEMRSWLGVPLLKEGNLLGAFTIYRTELRPFSDKQIALLTSFADQAVIAIENVRLFEQVQARTAEIVEALEQQTATSEVLKVISRSAFDLRVIFETLVKSAAQLCEAERATIWHRDGSSFRLVASTGTLDPQHEAYLQQLAMEPTRGTLVGRTLLEKQVVHIHDIQADREYTLDVAKTLGRNRTMLGIPLMRDGAPIGVIALQRSVVQPFTSQQIHLVETFADQAVIAVENARLVRELQEISEYQTATSDVLNVISRSPNQLQPVLETIVDTAGRLFEAYDVAVYLRDQSVLTVAAHRGPIQIINASWPVTREWVTGRAVADSAPVHIADLQALGQEFPHGQAMALRHGTRTVLSTPLLRDNVAIGAITLRRIEVRPFSAKQVALLQTFADQAVIAIENTRLFEEVQARTRELQQSLEYQTATSDVLKVISRSAFDLHTVLDTLNESAARLCGADTAIIRQREGDTYATCRDLRAHRPAARPFRCLFFVTRPRVCSRPSDPRGAHDPCAGRGRGSRIQSPSAAGFRPGARRIQAFR